MAEAGAPAGNGGQPENQPNQGQGNGTDNEPKWLSAIQDQALRDEAKKGWMMEADYRKKTSELSEQRKQWETKEADYKKQVDQFNEFYRNYEPIRQKLVSNWDKVQAILEGKEVAPQKPTDPDDPWKGFDLLDVTQQAQRIADYNAKHHLTPALEAVEKKILGEIAKREELFKRHFGVFSDAFAKVQENPKLPFKDLLQKAIEVQNEWQNGRINPLDYAASQLTQGDTLEAMKQEWMKKAREEAMREFQNQHQPSGALQNSILPSLKQKALTREQVDEQQRQLATKNGIPWF